MESLIIEAINSAKSVKNITVVVFLLSLIIKRQITENFYFGNPKRHPD